MYEGGKERSQCHCSLIQEDYPILRSQAPRRHQARWGVRASEASPNEPRSLMTAAALPPTPKSSSGRLGDASPSTTNNGSSLRSMLLPTLEQLAAFSVAKDSILRI